MLNTFKLLCNQSPEFILQNLDPVPIKQLSIPPSSKALESTIPFNTFCLYEFDYSGIAVC